METWNVVITVHEGYYSQARTILERLGAAHRTEFFNVLVMEVADIPEAMETFRVIINEEPEASAAIARFVPASQNFFFTSGEEFEERAKQAILDGEAATEKAIPEIRKKLRLNPGSWKR